MILVRLLILLQVLLLVLPLVIILPLVLHPLTLVPLVDLHLMILLALLIQGEIAEDSLVGVVID